MTKIIKIRYKDVPFIPASHEDPKHPAVAKRVLFRRHDFRLGSSIQMINWVRMDIGKSFASHYHEEMDEIFIVVSGMGRIRVGKNKIKLNKGDGILIPKKSAHKMQNIGSNTLIYIVIGIA